MEQIAAKVASLVPPAHQHRGEFVMEKPSEEKGRQLGEARRRSLERSAVEVKGAGGILVLGGLVVTAAIAAGVTIVSRRAQAKRPPASKKEKVEGLKVNDKLGESRIDGSAGIQEDDCVSAKPKSSSLEAVTCAGVEELRNGRVLGWEQLDEKNLGKTDLGLQNGIRKKEIDKQAEHGMINKEDALGLGNEEKEDDKGSESGMNQHRSEELLNIPKVCLVREEEDKEPSPVEAEDSLQNHYETELKQSIPALGNGENEDEPSLKQPHVDDKEPNDGQSDTNKSNQSTDDEISNQGCQSVRDRDEKVLAFLEESKESQFETVECKSNVSRQLGPFTFKEIVEQQKAEASPSEEEEEEARPQIDVIEQQTAQVIDEHKQQKEHEILTAESEDKVNEHQTEQISESEFALINEGKEPKVKEPRFHMTESEPFALKEEAKALSVGQQTEHVLNEHDLSKIGEHIEEKEENEASPEGNEEKKEAEGSSEGKEDEKEPKSSPEAEGEDIEEKKEAEVSPEKMEHEEIEDKKETDTSPEGEEKAEDEDAIEVKEEPESSVEGEDDGTYSNQTGLHIIQSEVSAEETEKTDEKGQPASFAEEEEGTNNNQTQTNAADPQLSTEDYSTVKEVEKTNDEKEEPESSVEGEDDGTYSNQTQPHIIQSEVSAEEFSTTKETEETDEKGQPASFAEEEEGSNNNQTQTNTADHQFSTEDYSTVKEVEKMDNEKEEAESFPEEEAQMRDKGSDGAPVSSAESNEAAISPAKAVEQGKILLREVESKVLSDHLISLGEVKVKVLVTTAEEKQQGRIDNVVHVHANKEEERRDKITGDKMQQQVMATIREKALTLEKFLMDIPDRLLVGLLAMALTMLLLHYVKPFSQLYQMVSYPEEHSEGI